MAACCLKETFPGTVPPDFTKWTARSGEAARISPLRRPAEAANHRKFPWLLHCITALS